ncbi:hypothetical protein pipiens_015512 [Culex pipiens pipiens]|uniref:Uncharacterized protein n=1 Tax=Culex pipiens pipiens TaxID=38569 RepID=A0ABD1CQ66_CULPP
MGKYESNRLGWLLGLEAVLTSLGRNAFVNIAESSSDDDEDGNYKECKDSTATTVYFESKKQEERSIELKMKNIPALRQPPYVTDSFRGSVAGDVEAASYEHF